jgi:hypothetical protein
MLLKKRVALIFVVFYDAEFCDLIAQDHDARAASEGFRPSRRFYTDGSPIARSKRCLHTFSARRNEFTCAINGLLAANRLRIISPRPFLQKQ